MRKPFYYRDLPVLPDGLDLGERELELTVSEGMKNGSDPAQKLKTLGLAGIRA